MHTCTACHSPMVTAIVLRFRKNGEPRHYCMGCANWIFLLEGRTPYKEDWTSVSVVGPLRR